MTTEEWTLDLSCFETETLKAALGWLRSGHDCEIAAKGKEITRLNGDLRVTRKNNDRLREEIETLKAECDRYVNLLADVRRVIGRG